MHDESCPTGVVGWPSDCEAPAVEVDDDGISFAALDLAVVVCGDVERELEASGVGAVQGGGGEVSVEGGVWG